MDCCKTVLKLKQPDGSRSQEWYESIDGSWKNAKYNRILNIKDYKVETIKDKGNSRDTFAIQRCDREINNN